MQTLPSILENYPAGPVSRLGVMCAIVHLGDLFGFSFFSRIFIQSCAVVANLKSENSELLLHSFAQFICTCRVHMRLPPPSPPPPGIIITSH